ncbi:hypothetical protein QC763_302950 [Podospora pseudopauciseta]|uniref:F-box domain-containing protein n=1 Tax=Podospora pseudopauciseta TaxID=2093780 RepID=A0ABR0HFX4_9PEZI|nr:hypothetical protein QC763_302950 [Podospora pseudopauciseta]
MKSLFSSRRKPPVQIPTDTQDLFAHLPTELIILVLEQLNTSSDIISALHVCRNWRDILLSPEIWPSIADRLVPGLTTHIRERNCSVNLHAQAKVFQAALNLHHLYQSGLFSYARHHVVRVNDGSFTLSKQVSVESGGVHSLAEVPGLDPLSEELHVTHVRLYSHGRIAWWPEAWHLPYFAVVDDLRARVRRMFLFPGQAELRGEDRRRGWKTALGEKLFVLGQEDAGVCVWHLERDEMKFAELPGGFDRCVVDGERLLFIGRRNAEVWLWEWAGEQGVREIDVARDEPRYVPGPVRMGGQIVQGYPRPAPKLGLRFQDTDVKVDFILHPNDWRVIFVVTWDEADLVVSEFYEGCMRARMVCPREHLAYRGMVRSRTDNAVHYLRTDRCDGRGGYVLMTAWVGEEPMCDAGHRGSIVSVCFNVHTSEFSALVHHASYQRTPAAHLWDGLLAVRVAGEDQNGLKPVVALLKPCDADEGNEATSQPGNPMPVRLIKQPSNTITPVEGNMTFVSEDGEIRPRAQSLHGMAHAFEAGGDARQAGTDAMKAEWLSGDDKTLVYVAGRDYTVWMFGEDGIPKEKKEVRLWKERFKNAIASTGRGTRA